MTTKTKRKYAKLLAAAVAATMTVSICATSLTAFAKSDLSTTKKYTNKYSSLADALKASGELNEQIEAEGIVMLKNKTGKAPLAKGAKVTVLGQYSLNPSYGGAGSGSIKRPGRNEADRKYVSETATDFYGGLEKDGNLVTNKAVKDIYAEFKNLKYENGKYMQLVKDGAGEVEFAGNKYNSLATGGTLQSVNNYNEYDSAIVVITRTGSEFYDNAAYKVAGHSDITDHYLELNDSEKELMAYAKKNFNKVIVLLNGPSAMEVGDLKNDDGIDAMYWVGQPGWNGFNVLGDVLTGKINPSGKLVDEWFTKFEYDPTWYNWGSYGQAEMLLTGSTDRESGTRNSTTVDMELPSSSALAVNRDRDNAMDYAEGIYLGYRYAETVYESLAANDKSAADAWYANTIAYPFGYGLSYTSFTKTIKGITGDLSNENGKITVQVEVANTGTVAGKEVVQIYSSAPYTNGGIEKAACDLVGFEKTDIIEAGAKETVEVEIAVKDLAAFDYNDANTNQNYGYELEAGKYVISVRDDSHTVVDSKELNAATTLTGWDEDGDASTPNNIFSQSGNNWEMYNTLAYHWTLSGDNHYITRATTDEDSTNLSLTQFATAATDIIGADEDKKDAAIEQMGKLAWLLTDDNSFQDKAISSRHQQHGATNDPCHDLDNSLTEAFEKDYKNVWTKEYSDLPADWTQATTVGADRIQAYTLLGEPMYLEDGSENPKWTAFMNQFTYEELALHGQSGSFSTPAVASVGLPKTQDKDGPAQMGSGWTWTCEVVIASTWNKELAYKQGLQNGYESMLQDTNGWYGPAANNHRNPLSGRNFEYYSQDGIHGGLIAANVIKGATDLGVHVYLKHAFLNDQETQRYGMATFATEQSIRLIYSKPWELAIRLGNLNGTMSAFNNVGNASSSSYAVMIQLYENEWGFDGYSVTDMYGGEGGSYHNMWSAAQMARGHNMPLGNVLNNGKPNKDSGEWSATANGGKGGVMIKGTPEATTNDTESPTQWYWVRTTAMQMMYTQVNGNAMKNGLNVSAIKGDSVVTGRTGEAITPVTVVDTAKLTEIFGEADKYIVTASGLPEGLTCSEAGVISGTPTTGKVGKISVTVTGKDTQSWMNVSGTISVSVAISKAVPTLAPKYSIITPVAIVLTDKNYVPGGEANAANNNKYVAHSWSIEGDLPEGLTFDEETGEIHGKSNVKGVYEITVKDNYTKIVRSGSRNNYVYTPTPETYETKYYIEVKDVEWFIVDGHLYHNGEDLGYIQGPAGEPGTPGTPGQDGKPGADGKPGQDGANGADGVGIVGATINSEGHLILTLSNGTEIDAGLVKGADGVNGADGESGGCGANVATGSVIAIASAFAIVCTAVVAKKLLKKKEN